jgi:tRNA wybutosine-synthesizing protein 2
MSRIVLGVRVARTDAEELRKVITSLRVLDKTHAIIDEDDFVVIPVKSEPDGALLKKHNAELVERPFPERKHREDPIDAIRKVACVPEELKHLLPNKWELFGDVAVIRLDSELDEYECQIAEAYASALNLKAVLRDVGGIKGEFREPVIRTLLGEDTVATHLENGIRYKFDAAKIMFSSGNIEERLRMADLMCDGETVVDMFAGIGYFSIPLAVYQRPSKVIACELNPVAYRFLEENIALNHVSRIVKPVLGDNRELSGEGIADRIIMGYVKTTHEHLPAAIRLLKSGGIIHYHETCPNELLPNRPVQRIMDNVKGGEMEIMRMKEIKSYAPGVTHVVVDAKIIKPS